MVVVDAFYTRWSLYLVDRKRGGIEMADKGEWCNSWDCEHNENGYCTNGECPALEEWLLNLAKEKLKKDVDK